MEQGVNFLQRNYLSCCEKSVRYDREEYYAKVKKSTSILSVYGQALMK